MQTLIYISGIGGGLLLVLRLVGIFMDFPFNNIILYTALCLLSLVCLPLYFIGKSQHDKKINKIIASYKGKEKTKKRVKNDKTKVKGWDMNTSPFRQRKSGVTYEGGNIYGQVGKRNRRRSFLR